MEIHHKPITTDESIAAMILLLRSPHLATPFEYTTAPTPPPLFGGPSIHYRPGEGRPPNGRLTIEFSISDEELARIEQAWREL